MTCRGALIGLTCIACGWLTATAANAQPVTSNAPTVSEKLAVMPMDALGMDEARVARLETLFRKEIERLSGVPLPSPREIDRALGSSRRLRRCAGRDRCLAVVGKRLGVDLVVSGNVAALGDSYVVDIKVVDVEEGEQVRRIQSDPLRGRPDELIESVRVAAYRLLAPQALKGSVMVLTDLVGAKVIIDGEAVGATPLSGPVEVGLGEHRLRVDAEGYEAFEEPIEIRFQKTTRVLVELIGEEPESVVPLGREMPVGGERDRAPDRWYQSTWFLVGAGVTAALVGGYVGYQLGHDPVVDCTGDPMACFD